MKKYILPTILILGLILILVVVTVYALPNYNPSDKTISFNFEKAGWYVVPYNPASGGCEDSIKAVWIWLPTVGKYVGSKSGPLSSEDGTLFSNAASLGYFQNGFSSFWVYLSKPCTFSYTIPTSSSQPLKLGKGWNFLTVNPIYDGKSLNDIKGTCNIENAYIWDSQNQQWGTILNLLDDKNALKNEAGIGGGFVVKVTDDCNLQYTNNNGEGNPPNLPN